MRAKKARPPGPPRQGVWLVDGHNVIHRVPALARLQNADRGEEARNRLAEACLRFALRHPVRVLLVFDGSLSVHAPIPPPGKHLEIAYAAGEGGADARIVSRATRFHDQKRSVLVVSNDRALKNALPRGVRTLGVTEFWAEVESPARARPEEKPEPSLPDVERFFLDAEPRLREELRPSPKKKGGA